MIPSRVAHFDVGDLVRVQASFMASGGAALNPDMVFLRIRYPGGSVATFQFGASGASITNPATGHFYKDITADTVGTWGYGWKATGVGQSAETTIFIVDESYLDPA